MKRENYRGEKPVPNNRIVNKGVYDQVGVSGTNCAHWLDHWGPQLSVGEITSWRINWYWSVINLLSISYKSDDDWTIGALSSLLWRLSITEALKDPGLWLIELFRWATHDKEIHIFTYCVQVLPILIMNSAASATIKPIPDNNVFQDLSCSLSTIYDVWYPFSGASLSEATIYMHITNLLVGSRFDV